MALKKNLVMTAGGGRIADSRERAGTGGNIQVW